MTQAKSKKPLSSANNLQKKYMSLSQSEQMGVTTFFNCHNAAHYVYDQLSDEAKSYISYCIKMSQNADKIEKQNSAQVS